MPHQRTTGLTATQFATLLKALTHYLTWVKPDQKPRKLTLTQALKKAPEKVLTPLAQPLKEILKAPGPLVVDGTVVPTWNWRSQGKTNFSGNHKKAGFNHQVICTLDGKLLAITDPLPGARYDAHAFRAHGLDRLLDSSTLADKGYVGLGLATPSKHKPGQRLSAEVKRNNRLIDRLRSVVERVIAQIKIWRVLHTGFRRALGSYGRVFSVVRGLVFLAVDGAL